MLLLNLSKNWGPQVETRILKHSKGAGRNWTHGLSLTDRWLTGGCHQQGGGKERKPPTEGVHKDLGLLLGWGGSLPTFLRP